MSDYPEIGPQRWPYPTIDITSDRSGARPATKPPAFTKLIGVDGSLRGGQRPFPGFIPVLDLDFYDNVHHDEGSEVNFAEVVTFNIGADGYGVAVVYRAKRSRIGNQQSRADVFVEIWNSNSDSDTTFGVTGHKVMHSVDPDAVMSVAVYGQFVYVGVEGSIPAMFYVKENDLGGGASSTTSSSSSDFCQGDGPDNASYTIVQFSLTCDSEDLTGPGLQPFLKSPEDAVTLGDLDLSVNYNVQRPLEGQIVLTSISPDGFIGWTGGSGTSSSSTELEDPLRQGRVLEDGGYNFMVYLMDSRTGRRSAPSQIAQARQEDFQALAPDESSSSPAEENDFYAAVEVIYDSDKFDLLVVCRSLRVEDAGLLNSVYLQVEKIITLADYQTIRNGTGNDFDPANTDMRHAVYYYQYEDKQLAVQPSYLGAIYADEIMPKGGAMLVYEGTMLITSIGGAGTASIEANRFGDSNRGVGELRYSAMGETSPELFSPSDRWVPNTPNNPAICLKEVGGNVIGLARDRIYHIHKRNTFLDAHEMHEGYGVTSPLAADSIGSMVVFATPTGLAQVDTTGELDEVRGFDHVFQEEWAGTTDQVSIGFDAKGKVLFVQNKAHDHMLCLWMRTAKMTEVYDTPFELVRRGVWFSDPDNFSSSLESRAVFLQNLPWNTGETAEVPEVLSGKKPRLMLVDFDRTMQITSSTVLNDGGNTERRMALLEFPGDSRWTTSNAVVGPGNSSYVPVETSNDPVGYASLVVGCMGCYLYVLDSTDASYIGRKAKIREVMTEGLAIPQYRIGITEEGFDALDGLPVGSRVGISPVYFRVEGYPLLAVGPQSQQTPYDSFTIKQLQTLYASFTDVEIVKANTDDHAALIDDNYEDARWRGAAFTGSSETVTDSAFPLETDGTKRESLVDGPSAIGAAFGAVSNYLGKNGVRSQVLSPAIEVFTPDVDFRLLGLLAEGKIEGTQTIGLPYINPTT